MAQKICTYCGYEGNGKREKASGGGIFRVLGILTMLPFHTMWKIFSGRNSIKCPHCGRPTLVKMKSAAGQIARRKFDVELGILTPLKAEEEKKPDALAVFGNDRPAETPINKKPVNPDEW